MEQWREVKEYGVGYEVSSWGRVRSFRNRGPKGGIGKVPRFMTQRLENNGYFRIGLRCPIEMKKVAVHRLVNYAFHAETWFEGAETNHIDGNKQNNHASNLEWVTRSQNMKHAYAIGLQLPTILKGSRSGASKLHEDDVQQMLWLFHVALCTTVELAKEFMMSIVQIRRIIRGKSWAQEYDKFPKNLIRKKINE